ncbi:MAG: hypothetical protein KGQ70_01590 [Alphaproteobacteria bacterium]|nr:hypothetical protein [Alphaproteobacteria bacterium]
MTDNKFWSRFNAMPNGAKLMAQAVVGGFFLLSAPVAVQVFGYAGCGLLGAAGLCAIAYGMPGAWQRMQNHFMQSFPHSNPLRRFKRPFRARSRKARAKPAAMQKPAIRLMPHEKHLDIFLSGVTLEGSVAGIVTWPVLAVPVILALPTLTVVGGLLLAGVAVGMASSIFGIFCSAETLWQACRKKPREQVQSASAARPCPPPRENAPELPPAATAAFNDGAARTTHHAAPVARNFSGPKP